MTVLEIMERAGIIGNSNRAMAYINDGLDEIQKLMPDNVGRITIDVVAGTRYYDISTNIARVLGVYRRKNTTDTSGPVKYIRIPLVANPEILEST